MTIKVTFECSFDRDVTVSSQSFEVKNSVPGGEQISSNLPKVIGNLGDTFGGIELRDSGWGFIKKIGMIWTFDSNMTQHEEIKLSLLIETFTKWFEFSYPPRCRMQQVSLNDCLIDFVQNPFSRSAELFFIILKFIHTH